MSPRKAISLRLPAELWDAVEARADELGQTRTKFVERALEKALGGLGSDQPTGGTSTVSSEMPARPAPSRASASPSLARFRQS